MAGFGGTVPQSPGPIYDPQTQRWVPATPEARARIAAYNAQIATTGQQNINEVRNASAARSAANVANQTGGTYAVNTAGGTSYAGAGDGPSVTGLRTAAGGGATTYGPGGTPVDELTLLRERARLQAEAEQRRMGQLGSSFSQPPVMYGGTGEEAARAAAFARAKDTAGQIARSSLNALRDVASSRGIGGSSIEGGMSADIVGGQANNLGEFSREQLIQDLERQRQIADLSYQGNITQRGQNLGLSPSLLGLIGSRAY